MASQTVYLPGPGTDGAAHGVVPDAAVRGAYLFTGGVGGSDAGGAFPDEPERQAANVYKRIDRILAKTGFSREEIGHWFVWSPVRLSNIKAVNPLWGEWFPNVDDRPARHALARELGPGEAYRIEIIGVREAKRRAYEIDGPYHTGGSGIPHFMPFGTTMGTVLFTGPTYGMDAATWRLGTDGYSQAALCAVLNEQLYAQTGHTAAGVAQIFVWYHDAASRAGAIAYTETLFPDRANRPAIHYIDATLPGGNFISGQLTEGAKPGSEDAFWQFLVQYDIIAVRGGRRAIGVPGVTVLDGDTVPCGVVAGDLCFTSAVLGTATGVTRSLGEQITAAFEDACRVVEAGGFSSADIGHAYVWYADHAAREAVDQAWLRRFPDAQKRPARHCVIAQLPPGVLAAVELTAAR